ncbi:TolC family outer membrane protein [Methylocucumis oryzae]|uniref:Type I secretion protein TolC n=1 Tax=Methylocucumis oryzae TaxID=1632867 RepID=A0A0F3IGE4_9GAMM|nr:TolC family outer membrane protein [Methylocucumis oryzae]KJV05762.1 hypothetical protein VZ94_15660 [Methylocucumis oryzae]
MLTKLLLAVSLGLAMNAHAKTDDLMTLYERALEASPELQGSEYALEIAKAREDQSFGRLRPQINAVGNYSLNRIEYDEPDALRGRDNSSYPGTRVSINLQQTIFDLQNYLLAKSQQSLSSQGEEELLAAHQKLIADLIERYMDALEATDKSEIIKEELSSTEKQLERVRAMHERQMAMVTDLYELEARTETLRSNLLESDNEAKIALEKLRELTGDAVTEIRPARLDVMQPPPDGDIEGWVRQIGQINPEVIALKHAVEAAKQSISAYQAGHLPTLQLQLSGIYSDTTFNNQTASTGYQIGSAAIQATIPIYEGGVTSARVREAEARKKYSESQLEQKLRELEKFTRAAYLDMASSSARALAADRQLAASEKSRDAMNKGYELGVSTIVDVLEAEKQLSEAKKQQRLTRYKYFRARSALYQQTGRLIGYELVQFNRWLIPIASNNDVNKK